MAHAARITLNTHVGQVLCSREVADAARHEHNSLKDQLSFTFDGQVGLQHAISG